MPPYIISSRVARAYVQLIEIDGWKHRASRSNTNHKGEYQQ